MQRFFLALLLFLPLLLQAEKGKRTQSLAGFIENKGQIVDQNNLPNPAVLFLLNTPGLNVQIREKGFSYDLYKVISRRPVDTENVSGRKNSGDAVVDPETTIRYNRIDFDLIDANPDVVFEASGISTEYLNYYTTGTPENGVTFVRYYQKVVCKNIYPYIDLEFLRDLAGDFKYNFVIRPGGDLNNVQIQITDPEILLSCDGRLRLLTESDTIEEVIPGSTYRVSNSEHKVTCSFRKINENTFGFLSHEEIPEGSTLVIDPVPTRRWGTYYGGESSEHPYVNTCKTDGLGNCIIGGYAESISNIASAGAHQTVYMGMMDGMLVKFLPDGQRLWGTYYGGIFNDNIQALSVDNQNNIFIGGYTESTTNIATSGAFKPTITGDCDAFFAKFMSNGILSWGTYYGGSLMEWAYSCAPDDSGYLYFTGVTQSPDGISTPGSFQPTYGGGDNDGFLVKFTGDGALVWGTYYGGAYTEYNFTCTTDDNSHVYMTGTTFSVNNIATPGSFQPEKSGVEDAFLACFYLNGQRKWGTYYGGTEFESIGTVSTNANNEVYITGQTFSPENIGTAGTYQPNLIGNGGAFIAKFDSNGNRIWGSYFGGAFEEGSGCAVDDDGNIFMTGTTFMSDTIIPTQDAYQSTFSGIRDAFIVKFDPNGQRIWGSYFGGRGTDAGTGIATDHDHNIYLYGYTNSTTGIATQGAHQQVFGGLFDNFLEKFADCYSPDSALVINGPVNVCTGNSGIVYSIDPLYTATSYMWTASSGITFVSGGNTTSVTVNFSTNTGRDTLTVYGVNSCGDGEPKSIIITVNPRPIPTVTGPDTVCTGDTAVYITNNGMTNYIWTVSSTGTIISGGSSADTLVMVKWTTGGPQWVRVNFTMPNGCPALIPTQKDIWVNEGPLVSITISAPSDTTCTGTEVSFTASGVNGGSAPDYQWMVNGFIAGTGDTTFTFTPADGDIVSCVLTSNIVCGYGNPATSNQINMTVIDSLFVSLSIISSDNPVCSGTSVTFSAIPANGGSSPSYLWKVNGGGIYPDAPTMIYTPANGDIVTCILISSDTVCVSNNPATSNAITMTVNPLNPATVTIYTPDNPFCPGSSVTCTATPVNGGIAPAYQWKENGVNAGTNAPTFSFIPSNNDSVRCIMTSDLDCVSNNPAVSNQIVFSGTLAPAVIFASCFDTITTLNAKPFKLKGGIPLNGTYSGPGVNSETGLFKPSLAGTGLKTITYSYTNMSLCSAQRTRTILVQSDPVFSCGNNLTDIRDNRIYPTVQIGSQCWMAANLNYGTMIPGSSHQRDDCINEKYCYNDLITNCGNQTYYQWNEIMRYDDVPAQQGICPPGWHIPTEAEWNTLFANWTSNGFAGAPLKFSGYSGFNALLSGADHLNRQWDFESFATFFWSSTPHGADKAWAHGMNDTDPSVSVYPSLRSNAFSVRCLKD